MLNKDEVTRQDLSCTLLSLQTDNFRLLVFSSGCPPPKAGLSHSGETDHVTFLQEGPRTLALNERHTRHCRGQRCPAAQDTG